MVDKPGAGNALAEQQAKASPLTQTAMVGLKDGVRRIADAYLRTATEDGLFNAQTCVRHRVGVDAKEKVARLEALFKAGLADPLQKTALEAGLFVPLKDEETSCPKLPLSFEAAPGSPGLGHHSWPGGLPQHVMLNLVMAQDSLKAYQGSGALPGPRQKEADFLAGAVLWHDWAKALVAQWGADGRAATEVRLGGLGQKDRFGQPGDSRTGAHHILSVAESMARELPAEMVVAQAGSHAALTGGDAYKIINWLRAAAILAAVDPVKRGYLVEGKSGHLELAQFGHEGAYVREVDGAWSPTAILAHMADSNWVMAEPSMKLADEILLQIGTDFGYDPKTSDVYFSRFRNGVLAQLSAERIVSLNSAGGLAAVRSEVKMLQQKGLL